MFLGSQWVIEYLVIKFIIRLLALLGGYTIKRLLETGLLKRPSMKDSWAANYTYLEVVFTAGDIILQV